MAAVSRVVQRPTFNGRSRRKWAPQLPTTKVFDNFGNDIKNLDGYWVQSFSS